MLNLISFCLFLFYLFTVVLSNGDMGPGVWNVVNVNTLKEDGHKFKFDVEQRKINRTHDGFNAKFDLDEEFNDGFGIRVDICKYVDGGCKPYQVLTDDSVVNFVNKYAEGNKKSFMEMAGIDPPDFPVGKGSYQVKYYIFNYKELPDNGIYGDFGAVVHLLQGTEVVGAMEVQVEFKEEEDHEDCDDHDDD